MGDRRGYCGHFNLGQVGGYLAGSWWRAHLDGETVGFGALLPGRPEELICTDPEVIVVVSKRHLGCRAGTLLLRAILAYATGHPGTEWVCAQVLVTNAMAESVVTWLSQGQGFVDVSYPLPDLETTLKNLSAGESVILRRDVRMQ